MSYDFKHDDSMLVLLGVSGKENTLTIKVNGKHSHDNLGSRLVCLFVFWTICLNKKSVRH